jgi:hypothetical protein
MALFGFAGFFILVTIGCVSALGLSIAENWQRILIAINGSEEAVAAARSFTTTQCSPAELPSVAQRMVLHDLCDEAIARDVPSSWSFEELPRRGRQIAFNFA